MDVVAKTLACSKLKRRSMPPMEWMNFEGPMVAAAAGLVFAIFSALENRVSWVASLCSVLGEGSNTGIATRIETQKRMRLDRKFVKYWKRKKQGEKVQGSAPEKRPGDDDYIRAGAFALTAARSCSYLRRCFSESSRYFSPHRRKDT